MTFHGIKEFDERLRGLMEAKVFKESIESKNNKAQQMGYLLLKSNPKKIKPKNANT